MLHTLVAIYSFEGSISLAADFKLSSFLEAITTLHPEIIKVREFEWIKSLIIINNKFFYNIS